MMLILSVTLVGCEKKPKYANDKIIISIKSDYSDEFINREFGLDDFNYAKILLSGDKMHTSLNCLLTSIPATGQ